MRDERSQLELEREKEAKAREDAARQELVNFFIDVLGGNIQPGLDEELEQLDSFARKNLVALFVSSTRLHLDASLAKLLVHLLKASQNPRTRASQRRHLHQLTCEIFWSDGLTARERQDLLVALDEYCVTENSGFEFIQILAIVIPLDSEYFNRFVLPRLKKSKEFLNLLPLLLDFTRGKEPVLNYGLELLFLFFNNENRASSHSSALAEYFAHDMLKWLPLILLERQGRGDNYSQLELLLNQLTLEEQNRGAKLIFVRRALVAALLMALESSDYSETEKGAYLLVLDILFKPEGRNADYPFNIDLIVEMTNLVLIPKLPGDESLPEEFQDALLENRKQRQNIQSSLLQSYYLYRTEASLGLSQQEIAAALFDSDFMRDFPGPEAFATIHQSLLADLIALAIRKNHAIFLGYCVDQICERAVAIGPENARDEAQRLELKREAKTLERAIPCALRAFLSAPEYPAEHGHRRKARYLKLASRLMDAFLLVAAYSDISAIEYLHDMATRGDFVRDPMMVYSRVVRHFFLEQAENDFKYRSLPALAWESLDTLLAQEGAGLRQAQSKFLRDLFISIILREGFLLQSTLPPKQVESLAARTVLAYFRASEHIKLLLDAPLFEMAWVRWDREFSRGDYGNDDALRAIDSISSFCPDPEERVVLRKRMLWMILYRYADLLTSLARPAGQTGSEASDAYSLRREDLKQRLQQIIFHYFVPKDLELGGELDGLFLQLPNRRPLERCISDIAHECFAHPAKAAAIPHDLYRGVPAYLPQDPTLLRLALPPVLRQETAIEVGSPRPAPPVEKRPLSRWEMLLYSSSIFTAGVSWGALQFALLADFESFPSALKHPAAVFFGVLFLSVPQCIYEAQEVQEALQRQKEAEAHANLSIHEKQHVSKLVKATIALFCCAEGFMRAMGAREVLERFTGLKSGPQWIIFTPIFVSTLRHFHLGEGYAFQNLINEDLFALDRKAIAQKSLKDYLFSWLIVRPGALLLSFSAFALVGVEAYYFLEEEILGAWDNEEDRKNYAYFVSSFLGIIAAIFASCKLGVGFQRLCHGKLTELNIFDLKDLGLRAWVLFPAAGFAAAYGFGLYRVMQEGLELLPLEKSAAWDNALIVFSALVALEYGLVRLAPSLINFVKHESGVHVAEEAPFPPSPGAYSLRLLLWDLVQLVASSVPLLMLPDHVRKNSWLAYLPSTLLLGFNTSARLWYQHRQYRRQEEYSISINAPIQAREALPVWQSILVLLSSTMTAYFGAKGFQEAWQSLAADRIDEEAIRWRVDLVSWLCAATLAILGLRVFFNSKNNKPPQNSGLLVSAAQPPAFANEAELEAEPFSCGRCFSLFCARLRGEEASRALLDQGAVAPFVSYNSGARAPAARP